MKFNVTREEIQDLVHYGIDVQDKLASMLSEELAKSIDREILKGLGIELDKNKRRKTSIDKIKSKNPL